MHPFVKLIVADTEAERVQALNRLEQIRLETPSDREMVIGFLKDCTSMGGASLTLNNAGTVAEL